MCLSLSLYIYIYIYTHTHTHRKIEEGRDIQADRNLPASKDCVRSFVGPDTFNLFLKFKDTLWIQFGVFTGKEGQGFLYLSNL